ncbi:MAG: hypothetical protein K6F04_03500 [bacterium]|nr:hypothetical protein [bacterium]
MKFKNDMGRSMMEMILYLGLIVVLTASTLKMYADSVEKTRIIKFENQVDDLREYVNTYFLGRPLPTDNNVYKTSFANAIGGTTKLDDPWGGVITLKTIDANKSFSMTFTGKDQKTCINIGNTLLTKDSFSVTIGSVALTGDNLTIAKVAENCKTTNNTIIGSFYKN